MKHYHNYQSLIRLMAVMLPFGLVLSKYLYFNRNLPEYSLISLAAKAVVLILCFVAGYLMIKHFKEEMSIKLIFRQLFIIVLIGELSIALADYMSIFHLFPNFINDFHQANQQWLSESSNWPQEKQNEALADILNIKNMEIRDVFLAFLRSVIISSIFAFIFAAILNVMQRKSLQIEQMNKSYE